MDSILTQIGAPVVLWKNAVVAAVWLAGLWMQRQNGAADVAPCPIGMRHRRKN